MLPNPGTVFGRLIVALVGCLGLAGTSAALDPSRSVDEYAIESWNTETGLPHNQVQAIAQTGEGYLWFGTWEGAVRFNTHEFAVFDRRSVPELRDSGVRVLTVDRTGALWLGTSRGGVARLKDGVWRRFDRGDGLISDEVLCIAQDREGRIWIGMEEGGISIVDDDRVRSFSSADGLLHNTVLAMSEASDGSMWIATSKGLNQYRGGRLTAPNLGPLTPRVPVLEVFTTRAGVTMVGTDAGLFRLDNGQLVPAAPNSPLDGQAISLVHEDGAGALWVGTIGGGLFRMHGKRVERLTTEHGLPHNRIIAVQGDREGNLWIGTSAGLVRLKDAPFSTFGGFRGLSENYTRAIRTTHDGALWVGTGNGLNRLDGRRFTTFWPGGDPVGNYVMAIEEDADGSLWLGTYDSGLAHFNGKDFTHLGVDEGLAGDQVRAILRDHEGVLWVGTTNGLNRIQSGKIERFGREHGLPREYIFSLFQDRDRQLWVGTTSGAAVHREGRFEALPMPHDQEVKDVFAFHQTDDGTVWAATSDGILRHQDGQSRIAGSRHGPIPDAVFNILEDGAGYFWVGSNRGIYRIARDELDAVMDGRDDSFNVRLFDRGDGLVSSQCNGGSQPSAWKTGDGRLWFATAKGVAIVDPKRLALVADAPPPTVIERLLVNGASADFRNPQNLPPGRHKIEIDYAGLSYADSQSVRYRYRMRPYDGDWVDAGTQRQTVYTNLAPGSYRFEVQSRFQDGSWGEQSAAIEFEFAPHFWQTAWFGSLSALALALLVLGLLQWRTASLRRREQMLSELVAVRTSDLELRQRELIAANEEKGVLLVRIREQADEAERQARTDALSGLANRRHFDRGFRDSFARMQVERRPVCAALVDIDHFKQINDRYSHQAGDEVIRAVAHSLRQMFPGDFSLVSRYGGEEFAIGFPDMTLAEAQARCERMRERVAQIRFDAIAPDLRVTVSIGVAEAGDSDDVERLLANADERLYDAKRGGRNRVCV